MDQSNGVFAFDELLPECKVHILQFLSLQDCLTFTSTSKKNLVAALPQLRQRRQKQFYQRYCYQIENPTLLQPSNKKWDPSADDNSTSADDDSLFASRIVHKHQWYTIPSVGERVIQLYRCIPASHPANKDLQVLKAILVQGTNEMEEDTKDEPPDFDKSLQQLCDCTRAHKLHASILSKSTVKCIPRRCDRYSTTARARYGNNENNDPNTLSATLDTYMGDVLVAYYLMGNKISGVIEGGPSFFDWNKHIFDNDNGGLNAQTWYQLWVYMHSTLLRTFPFSVEHAKALLGTCNGILGHHHTTTTTTSPAQDVNYVHPHYCYIGIQPERVELTQLVLNGIVASLYGTMDGTMTTHQTTMNEFGPLGPAFRGRDEVRTCIMNPLSLLSRLQQPFAFHTPRRLSTSWFLVEQEENFVLDSTIFRQGRFYTWFQGTDAVVRWMLEIKVECSKVRPMTVMPPVVTLEPVDVEEFLMHNGIQ